MESTNAKIFRFLSILLRDEISSGLFRALQDTRFMEALAGSAGGKMLSGFLRDASIDTALNELAYEYADLFLNAGPNPVFPYESAHVTGRPLVMQKSIFVLRQTMRQLKVKPSPTFRDLEEHAAVEMELAAVILEREKQNEFEQFLSGLFPWLSSFFDQLRASAQSDFYRSLGALGRVLIDTPDDLKPTAEAVAGLGLEQFPSLVVPGVEEERPEESVCTHCYTCGALCGMTAKLKDGVLMGTGGLPGDPKGGGRLCVKGGSADKHVYSAYRLKTPLIKENGRFRKVSWKLALEKAAEGIKDMVPGELGYFRGNDFVNWIHEALFDHLGCPKTTHRPMCDNSNRMSNEHTLNDKRPWINYEESDFILHFGMNELATSYGQRKTSQLKSALKKGAKLVVFDPRKSETAAKATEWIPLKPGTDGAVAMAMAYVIIRDKLYDDAFIRDWTTGFDAFKGRIMGDEDGRPRTPEWASEISGVPTTTIERIAREFAAARNKGALSWTGLAQVPNGMHGTAAVQALNGLCGTFDAPGGPSLPFKRKLNSPWGPDQVKPPKGDAPKLDVFNMWSGWAPALALSDVKAGKLKGMIVYYGDPVLSWGNQEATSEAIRRMAFKVAIDAFMSNTALLCDVVLPDATWLEQSQVKPDWLYEAFISYFAQVVEPMYDTKPIWQITILLAEQLGLREYFPWNDIEEAFRNQLADTPWSFDELKANGFIVTDEAAYYKYKQWGSINPPTGYGSSGKSKTGKYNFLNPVAKEKGVDPLPDFKEPLEELQPDEAYPFILGNFRLLQHEHSSTLNNFQLMKLKGTNPLWINDQDGARIGIESGDRVRVVSPWGTAELEALVTSNIAPGILGAAGGYGHTRGLEADPKYAKMGGVNVAGQLMKPNCTEPMGGTPPLKYIKSRLEKV